MVICRFNSLYYMDFIPISFSGQVKIEGAFVENIDVPATNGVIQGRNSYQSHFISILDIFSQSHKR